MHELLRLFVSSLAALIGFSSYIPAQPKVFRDDGYYVLKDGAYPNDRLLYDSTIAKMSDSEQECDLSPYKLDENSGRQIVETGNGGAYFPFTLGKGVSVDGVIKGAKEVKIDNSKYYLFSVPQGTEIIAPYNCTLDNSSTTVGTIYPQTDVCKGVCMTVETDELADGTRYKITYATLLRLWDCMRKKEPDDKYDNNDRYPIYYSDKFSDKITFNQKDVLGEAGKTGVPDTAYGDDAYVAIKIEKMTDGAYGKGTIQELCKLN